MPINSFLYPGAKVTTAYEVANSCRFDDGSSDYLNNTSVSTVTSRFTFTISLWVKRSTLGAKSMIGTVGGDSTNFGAIWFDSSDRLNCTEGSGGGTLNFITNRLFRDVSAWYHIVLAIDTTQSTESNRVKIYVNGVQETSFSTSTYPPQNSNMHLNRNGKTQYIGRHTDSTNNYYFDGYITEVVWVDGQQLSNTDLGEFDSDSPNIWKPIDVSGLTFGNNGFYLDFENSGSLGADVSGNSNNFTVNNLTSVDQSTDTCTNNFCTLNPLDNYYQAATFSEGNCKIVTAGSSNTASTLGTFGVNKGKWFWEAKFVSDSQGSSYGVIGIEGAQVTSATDALLEGTQSYGLYLNDGKIWTNNSSNNHGAHIDLNAIIGVALDLDNNRIYFSKDGQWGDGSGNWDEASPNNYLSVTAAASVALGNYFPAHGDWSSGTIGWEVNFGNPTYSISSGNSDANGYGNFEYAVPSGYYSLCSKNLAEFG
jgi:hypothetical protein